jgi:hypothetical protein
MGYRNGVTSMLARIAACRDLPQYPSTKFLLANRQLPCDTRLHLLPRVAHLLAQSRNTEMCLYRPTRLMANGSVPPERNQKQSHALFPCLSDCSRIDIASKLTWRSDGGASLCRPPRRSRRPWLKWMLSRHSRHTHFIRCHQRQSRTLRLRRRWLRLLWMRKWQMHPPYLPRIQEQCLSSLSRRVTELELNRPNSGLKCRPHQPLPLQMTWHPLPLRQYLARLFPHFSRLSLQAA